MVSRPAVCVLIHESSVWGGMTLQCECGVSEVETVRSYDDRQGGTERYSRIRVKLCYLLAYL